MPKNVVLWDGSVVTVSDEDAARLASGGTGHEQTAREENARAAEQSLEDNTGAFDKARAFIEGGFDMATGGLYGKAVTHLGDDEQAHAMRRAAQVAPGYRLAGELVTGLAPTGLLGRGAKAAGEATAVGGATRLGRAVEGATGSRTVGRLAEGGVMGTGGYVAQTNVTGDPVSVEGLMEGAGIGGVLNVGAGVLADRLMGMSKNAQKAIAEADDIASKREIAKSAEQHFEADAGVNTAYTHFKAAVKAREATSRQALKEWEKQEKLYRSFADNPQTLARTAEEAENVLRTVRSKYSPHPPTSQTPQGQHPGFDISDVEGAPGRKGLDVEWVDGKPRAVHYKFDPKTGEEFKILHDSQPPISQEEFDRLRGFEARISNIYQKLGGRTKLTGGARWAGHTPGTGVKYSPEELVGDLRSLRNDMVEAYAKRTNVKMRPIPAPLPERPQLPSGVELASSFKAFTRQRPETIAKMVQGMDDETAAQFQRVVDELGVRPGATAQESVLAVHNQARGWLEAIDAAKAEATAAQHGGRGFFEIARRFVRNIIRFKAGMGVASAVGGPVGSALGVATSATVGAGIDSLDNAVVGGALITSKTGLKSKVSGVVAKYGGTVASKAAELGPVTAYLGSAGFYGGKADEDTDLRKQARNRIDEIHAAMNTAPDTAFAAVEGLLGDPSDIAHKVHAFTMGALSHLASLTPKDPGMDIKMFESKWVPTWKDSVELAHRLEAVHAPLSSLARLMSGQGLPAAAETLWTVWPATMQVAAAEIVEKAMMGEYSTERASAFSRIFRVPLTGFQHPAAIAALQGQYLPPPELGAGGGSASAPQPTGRPPAVQSPVAGSNVAALTA